ncbi:CatB-related O-acetyltransferase [Methylophilus sp. 13]|uniref:CatB-related O-acetyltransferase n=1 Tax=Methylophilus sp. 13 TaxID=2781018 RepID=UPI00188F9F01|nr:CatB-related O-acetyltransferase [Methylophilus sp. 13]MBF5038002.1 CatB-related O-acetyltransferase [Methylophilus sp. 13]
MKDQFTSSNLRKYFLKNYQIEVGMYSYGCFDERRIARGTKIGRFCSIAPTAYIFNGNHGITFLTLHPYAYNPALGIVPKETIARSVCIIEDDVWLGHNSIITPSVKNIGRGAIVAAGAVVTKNVPPYSVVAGNPAKIIKYRFTPEIIKEIEQTKWWELDYQAIKEIVNLKPDLIFDPISYFETKKHE